MEWLREGTCLPPAASGDPDRQREWRPWVVQDGDSLRMWYAGHDGSRWRILQAVRQPDGAWERVGVAVDAGLAGTSDAAGVQSPCVVRTQGGYLMAYVGDDGERTRLHLATSLDGGEWNPFGTVLGGEDARRGASHPCLLLAGSRRWVFFSGYDGQRPAILAAVSETGGSWERLGPVLLPDDDEVDIGRPCVLQVGRELEMWFAADRGEGSGIELAVSRDGMTWERRGATLPPSGDGPDGLATDAPCALRTRDGTLRLWYAALAINDTGHAYRICSAASLG